MKKTRLISFFAVAILAVFVCSFASCGGGGGGGGGGSSSPSVVAVYKGTIKNQVFPLCEPWNNCEIEQTWTAYSDKTFVVDYYNKTRNEKGTNRGTYTGDPSKDGKFTGTLTHGWLVDVKKEYQINPPEQFVAEAKDGKVEYLPGQYLYRQ